MATTISAQNALQIREQPMDVYINFQTGSSATISSYTVTNNYKNYDSTLANTAWTMRRVADLQGDGFPLDGSYELYDSSITSSSTNGKLGVRGTVGTNVVIAITSSATLTAVTIATENADTITVGGTTYTATGLNVVSVNAKTATITITPTDSNSRVYVNYIVPGIILNITNNNLISCTLALRSNLNVKDHSWEQSEIEVQVYYPYNIADSFAYVQNDWPITYRAGYDADLSPERKFYLSEPIEQVDNIITIKGVDASHWLDDKTMIEQWYTSKTGNAHKTMYDKFVSAITSAGVSLVHKQTVTGSNSGTEQICVIPEMTSRDFVSGVMNYTMSTNYGIQFVDAGIPSVEYGDGTTYGNAWYLQKSDCGEWTETYEQNIATLKDTSDEHKYAETFSVSSGASVLFGNTPYWQSLNVLGSVDSKEYTATKKNQIVDLSYDGFYKTIYVSGVSTIANCPSRFYGKVQKDSYLAKVTSTIAGATITRTVVKNGAEIIAAQAGVTGGVTSYSNPNGLAGITVELDPFIYGNITDGSNPIIDYKSLFNRSNHTVSFVYKGDPRWQPLDYLAIDDDVDGNGTTQYRITSIELTHSEGGTQAKIEAREWNTNNLVLVLGDDENSVLVDDDGNALAIEE